jgi:hypothetical protein
VAAAAGAIAGIGIGWLVAVVAGPIFGTAAQGTAPPLVIEPVSLAVGAGTGLVISLLTIWATSLRIACLNIIRAIRDLPEPKINRARARTLVLAAAGILVGAAVGFAGYLDDNAIALCLGVPVAAFSASPLLRRLMPERAARLLTATTVLGWGLAVYPLFPGVMAAGDMMVFVVQGVVLTAGAVSLASGVDRVWAFAIERLARGSRGLAPRLGIAYPLAGDEQVVDRFYLAAAGTAEADALTAAVNAEFLAHGADARTFATIGTAEMGELLGFIALLRAFLGLGLLVGIAGLGVVMVRAVRERRHEIGMLRAMGFSTGIVRGAMLSEAGLIAVQGTVIGAVLGLVTTRQLLAGSDSFGDVPPPFVLPWVGLLVILGLPLLASLAATAWPASRAAAIKPAVALRTAD